MKLKYTIIFSHNFATVSIALLVVTKSTKTHHVYSILKRRRNNLSIQGANLVSSFSGHCLSVFVIEIEHVLTYRSLQYLLTCASSSVLA